MNGDGLEWLCEQTCGLSVCVSTLASMLTYASTCAHVLCAYMCFLRRAARI